MLSKQQDEMFASTSTATTRTELTTSTSTATRPSFVARQRQRSRTSYSLLTFVRKSCRENGKGKERESPLPSRNGRSLAIRCIGIATLLLQVPATVSAAAATREVQHSFLRDPQQERMGQALLLSRSISFDVSHNRPLQLVIIVGSIIFFVMLVTTLACFFRTPKSKKAAAMENEKNMTRGDWNSSVPIDALADIYTTIDLDGKKSRRGRTSGGAGKNKWLHSSAFGPFSPAPRLNSEKDSDGFFGPIQLGMDRMATSAPQPPPAAGTSLPRDRRFPTSAALERIRTDDLELAGSQRLSRRPSFIDRALAIRANPNDPRPGSIWQQPEPYVAQAPSRASRENRDTSKKASGSAILSALSGTFPTSFRGSRENTKRQHPIESDYEGTIGGKDSEIPMARRLRASQARFPCDASTVIESPEVNSPDMDDRFSPLPNRCVGNLNMTPRTPGLAGVGTTWGNVAVVPVPPMARRVASFADLQRQAICSEESDRMQIQASIDDWVQSSKTAARPPLSRGNTNSSFLSATSSTAQFMAAKSRFQSDGGHAALSSMGAPPGSWLSVDYNAKDFDSIIGEYLVEDGGSDAETKSQISSSTASVSVADTDFDRKRGNLWESQPIHHRNSDGLVTLSGLTQFHRQKALMERGRAMSADAASPVVAAAIPAPWTRQEEDAEEQKRQIDRRQSYLLREQRKAERRNIKQQRERVIVETASYVPRQHPSIPMASGDTREGVGYHHPPSIAQAELLQQQPPKMMHLVVPIHEDEEDVVEGARRAEEAELQLRICPSLQQLHAPVLTLQDEIVAQSRSKVQKLHGVAIHHRPSVRAPSLSPPESPLTSASEVSEQQQYRRPKTGRFLVESRKNSLATVVTTTTQRSFSDASSMTMQSRQSRRQGQVQHGAVFRGQAQNRQHHHHQLPHRQRADRCVSEQRQPPLRAM